MNLALHPRHLCHKSARNRQEEPDWRLRDGRWLLWRIAHEDGACNGNRGFYSFSEKMPK